MIFTLEADIRGYLSSVDETHRTPNKNSLVCFPLELSPGRLIPHGVENETYFRLYGTKYSSLFNRIRWKSSWLFDCSVFYAASAIFNITARKKIVMNLISNSNLLRKSCIFPLWGYIKINGAYLLRVCEIRCKESIAMSFGATVGASTENSNLNWTSSYLHCDFSKRFNLI